MGICFIPKGNYPNYIANLTGIENKKGNFIDKDGNVLGTHHGTTNYTIGQKRGKGMAFTPPLTVLGIKPLDNEIILGDEKDVYSDYLIAKNPTFAHFDVLVDSIDATVKICQWGYFLKAKVSPISENTIKVTFKEPVRAIAPGQNVVIYDGSTILGGAEIVSSHNNS